MRFLLIALAGASAALASTIPNGVTELNPNEEVATNEEAAYNEEVAYNVTKAVLVGNTHEYTEDVEMAGAKQSACSDCIAILYERPNFGGQAYGVLSNDMGDSPEKGHCTAVPHGAISSIHFEKQNNNHRAAVCYIYSDDKCEDKVQKNFVGDTVSNLKKIGWDDRMQTILCYWKGDEGSVWKRDDVRKLTVNATEALISASSGGSGTDAVQGVGNGIAAQIFSDANQKGLVISIPQSYLDYNCVFWDTNFFTLSSMISSRQEGISSCTFYTNRDCNRGQLKTHSWTWDASSDIPNMFTYSDFTREAADYYTAVVCWSHGSRDKKRDDDISTSAVSFKNATIIPASSDQRGSENWEHGIAVYIYELPDQLGGYFTYPKDNLNHVCLFWEDYFKLRSLVEWGTEGVQLCNFFTTRDCTYGGDNDRMWTWFMADGWVQDTHKELTVSDYAYRLNSMICFDKISEHKAKKRNDDFSTTTGDISTGNITQATIISSSDQRASTQYNGVAAELYSITSYRGYYIQILKEKLDWCHFWDTKDFTLASASFFPQEAINYCTFYTTRNCNGGGQWSWDASQPIHDIYKIPNIQNWSYLITSIKCFSKPRKQVKRAEIAAAPKVNFVEAKTTPAASGAANDNVAALLWSEPHIKGDRGDRLDILRDYVDTACVSFPPGFTMSSAGFWGPNLAYCSFYTNKQCNYGATVDPFWNYADIKDPIFDMDTMYPAVPGWADQFVAVACFSHIAPASKV